MGWLEAEWMEKWRTCKPGENSERTYAGEDDANATNEPSFGEVGALIRAMNPGEQSPEERRGAGKWMRRTHTTGRKRCHEKQRRKRARVDG